MGKRSGGFNMILRRRLEHFKHRENSTVDEIVHYLRDNYPDYHRTKLLVLKRSVQQTLGSFPSRTNLPKRTKTPPPTPIIFDSDDADEDGDGGDQSGFRKKPKRSSDQSEKRLLKIEKEHLRRMSRSDQDCPSTSAESSSDSPSEESSDDGDGAVSTSEDGVYSEKVEPEFDLTKSMLRARYTEFNKASDEKEEKNVELELPGRDKIDMVNEEDGGRSRIPSVSKREAKGSVSKSEAVSVVKGNEGPKFKDLGGMDKVLEELKMEVLVPLCHPQLPRSLGVKPMAGILLHGPPGCGKTKLAHAIANETGLPFYKISATEVVSGVSGMILFFDSSSCLIV